MILITGYFTIYQTHEIYQFTFVVQFREDVRFCGIQGAENIRDKFQLIFSNFTLHLARILMFLMKILPILIDVLLLGMLLHR